MRIKNSIFNMIAAFSSQIIMVLLGFFSRTVFISTLGSEYLGVSGLFTNILSLISLAESGIGSSIVFCLYKPVADKDEEKIITLINLYKKAFLFISFLVLIIGITLLPFIKYFINGDSNIENLYLIYTIFVFNSAITYLFSYKITFLNVCQKSYIVTSITTLFSIVAVIIKMIILYLTQNYILYLIVDSIITVITQLCLSKKADKLYPYLKRKPTQKLDSVTQAAIIKNIKSLIIHNIGGRVVFGTDNLLISSFVSVIAVGLYSNYLIFINLARSLINTIFNSIENSFGDLIAHQEKEKIYLVYRAMNLCVFWLNSSFAIIMCVCLEPVIELWLGKNYLMGQSVVIILMISFYVSGMRRAINIVKSKSGIFYEDRFAPLCEACINLISSIIFVKYFGISGIFMGTIISTLLVPFWIAPKLVYEKVFEKSFSEYLKDYLIHAISFISTGIVTILVCNKISDANLLLLIGKGLVATLIPNCIYIILFRATNEFRYLFNIINNSIFRNIKKVSKINFMNN
ncbi:lipopolysaccharide biosynthesis protein [Turicibacter sanguinis]|uniref:lipopolysaccharide biosynthesis protein n=1 Tax=Turicibacter sanguinis TaxID=154288 RepID=UPI0018ABC54F|nr:hypothetical protein [Turicibacter sanguinis]MDB8558411.1 hypothetical protein [Turicibacter sanguinis]MDB8561207.1 hypothetical protein [Turicibacter sanguinis]